MQSNMLLPSPKTTFVVPQLSVHNTHHVTNGVISAYTDDIIQTKTLSSPSFTINSDTDVDVYDE